jgi:lysophospholipase L1-like esterase
MAVLGNILPVGDSITVGTFGSDDGSYRDFLFPALTAAGHTFTELARHASSGWRVAEATVGLADRITTDGADLLLVYIGVNDIRSDGKTAAQVAADMNDLVTTARTANPNIDIILAEIAPSISTETANNLVIVDYNAELVTLAAGLDGAVRTITADCHTGFTDGMLVDNVHPNDLGDEHISDAFLVGIGNLSGEPVSTTTWGNFSNVASSGGTASVWGTWSAWALGEGAPAAGPVLSLTAKTDTTVDLAWTDTETWGEYQVERDGLVIDTATVKSYQDTGRTPNTGYDYRVRGRGKLVAGTHAGTIAQTLSPVTQAATGTHTSGVPTSDFLTDTFTDVNGTLLVNHTPEAGGTWENLGISIRNDVRADLAIQNNMAVNYSNWHRNNAVPPGADVEVTATFQVPAGSGVNVSSSGTIFMVGARFPSGVVAEAADLNGYVAGWWGQSGWRTWAIGKVEAGVYTWLVKIESTNPDRVFLTEETISQRTVRFECTDAVKRLYVNNVLQCETTDNSITQVGRVVVDLGQYSDSAIVEMSASEVVT